MCNRIAPSGATLATTAVFTVGHLRKAAKVYLIPKTILNLGIIILLIGCASGPVTTEINPNKNPASSTAPSNFQSPFEGMNRFAGELELAPKDRELKRLASTSLKSLLDQQSRVEKELGSTGRLLLKAGQSYEFDLESFCVNAGVERPVTGDGLFLGDISGKAKSWLPLILAQYKTKHVSQNDAQVLVWSLLSGSRFNELSSENQENLLKFFPDAQVRFGNSLVEESATSLLSSQIPSELLSVKNDFDKYDALLQNSHAQFQDIEQVLSPHSSRTKSLPVGWLKHDDGYYVRLTADGYQRVHVQIYAPESLKSDTYFKPTEQIALPSKGQRLALSGNPIPDLIDDLNRRFKKLTGASLGEAAFVAKHPLDSYTIYQLAQKSLKLTWNNFDSKTNFEDDKADAFRHFTWSSMVVHEIGESKAREFLDAHEDYPGNKPDAKAMDLFNNQKGIEFAKAHPSESDSFEQSLVQSALDKIRARELKWLK